MSFVEDPALKTRTLPPAPAGTSEGSFYLLVVQEGSSSVFHLPRTGVVTVGRAPECDLAIDDASISRRHARFVLADGEVRVLDLESRNGTAVNGERLDAPRALFSGDVVTLGVVTLVLHHHAPMGQPRSILRFAELRRRLEEEVERALHYHRPLAVLALTLAPGADRSRVGALIDPHLRRLDVAGWEESGPLLVLFPEYAEDEAREAAEELVEALSTLGEVRGGISTCPEDGCQPDALLATARNVAASAEPGKVATSEVSTVRVQVGGQYLVLADPAMHRLYELIRRLAQSDLPVLISGETGTGKELAAAAVHESSPRAGRPFVVLNCAALQETLVESELFGFEKGAFSGAVASKPGLLEAARGGTVFLDEIGELPLSAQAKLLRAVETQRITRLGDVKERQIDIRIVAATNRDLKQEVEAGRFRRDLFFRLGAATVVLPPLRDRPREIPILARTFLEDACARAQRAPMELSVGALQTLAARRWPGNVRELKNLMGYLVATMGGSVVEPWHLTQPEAPAESAGAAPAAATEPAAAPPLMPPGTFRPIGEELRDLERTRMIEALQASGGVQKKAAQLLGMPLRTFVLKMKQYDLRRRGYSS